MVLSFCHGQAIQKLLFSSYNDNTGIDFGTNPSSLFYTGVPDGFEAISHVEDGNGNIIFWIISTGIYDANFNLMPNSSGIWIDESSAEINIIPFPNDPNRYYIVYNRQACSTLYYSVVDMSLNGGLGEVTTLNTLLNDLDFSEGLETVRIPCTDNYNLIAFECDVGFWSFLIDDSGIDTIGTFLLSVPETPETSVYDGRSELDYHNGRIGLSYGFAQNVVFLGNYNPVNNTLSGSNILVPSIMDQTGSGMMGLEFSPDGSKAYVSNWVNSADANDIFCYDFNTATWINQWNSIDITNEPSNSCGQIELGPDNSLYIITDWAYNIIKFEDVNNGTPTVSVINTVSLQALGISDHIQSDVMYPIDTTNIEVICLADSINYQVSFEVLNGVQPYSVSGISGSFSGSSFLSDPIPTFQNFSFGLTDAVNCNTPINFEGAASCTSCQVGAILSGDTIICENNFEPFDIPLNVFGTPPYELNYSFNGNTQTPIQSVTSPININVSDKGILELISLTDGNCTVQLIGNYEINTEIPENAGTGMDVVIEIPDNSIFNLFDFIIDLSTQDGQWYNPFGQSTDELINQNSIEGIYTYVIPATNVCPSDSAFVNLSFEIVEVEEPVFEPDDIVFPNIFSPNDDGVNDEFKPNRVSGNNNIEMSIYNRWGERMFFTNDALQNGWDGAYNGAKVDIGVYVYIANTIDSSDNLKFYKGNLTLIR